MAAHQSQALPVDCLVLARGPSCGGHGLDGGGSRVRSVAGSEGVDGGGGGVAVVNHVDGVSVRREGFEVLCSSADDGKAWRVLAAWVVSLATGDFVSSPSCRRVLASSLTGCGCKIGSETKVITWSSERTRPR